MIPAPGRAARRVSLLRGVDLSDLSRSIEGDVARFEARERRFATSVVELAGVEDIVTDGRTAAGTRGAGWAYRRIWT